MGLLGQIRDRLNARHKTGVVFIHPQKCGGSSLETALFRHYRLSRERIFPIEARNAARTLHDGPDAPLPEIEASTYRQFLVSYALERGVKCVTGHVPFSPALQSKHGDTHKFITVLREPVARFCSHLRYAYNSGMETSAGDDVDAFLESRRARYSGALYAYCFGGWTDLDEPVTEKHIDDARENILALDAVGYLDCFPAFLDDISALLGARITAGHENKTTDRKSSFRGEFTPSQMAKIRQLCEPSAAIYEYVRKKRPPADYRESPRRRPI